MNISSTFAFKLKHLYLRYLLLSFLFILAYLALYWFFFIFLNYRFPALDFLQVLLPILLAGIAVFIWYRPRLSVIRYKNPNSKTTHLFIACFALYIPTYVGSAYLEQVCGKLTLLPSINALKGAAKSKFYQVKSYYLDCENYSVYQNYYMDGKHNENFNMEVHIAIPILASANDTQSNHCSAYLSMCYQKTLSSNYLKQSFENEMSDFKNLSLKEYEQTDFTGFQYLETIEPFRKAYYPLASDYKYQNRNAIVFEPHYTAFNEKGKELLQWILGGYLAGLFICLLLISFGKLDTKFLQDNSVPH